MREKYSAGPKDSATAESAGPEAATSSVPTVPPRKEAMAAVASAAPARPFWAIL